MENLTYWEHRPHASAGGRHPIDIFIINTEDSKNSIYLYQPIFHSLAALDCQKEKVSELIEAINNVLPIQKGTIIWFGAQFAKTLSKYRNGESLVWKDVGVLTATITLVAEALNLNCCPLGITGEPFVSQIFASEKEVVGVGGILIGGR
jgi:SagB-type dehydrogenase family enzyme